MAHTYRIDPKRIAELLSDSDVDAISREIERAYREQVKSAIAEATARQIERRLGLKGGK